MRSDKRSITVDIRACVLYGGDWKVTGPTLTEHIALCLNFHLPTSPLLPLKHPLGAAGVCIRVSGDLQELFS
jgi:hypothetical protein